MAVQKSKKARSKRGMRRSHDSLNVASLCTDKETGEIHLRHHMSKDGSYRGRQIISEAIEEPEEDEE